MNNYEDPEVFYLADVRGWVVPIHIDDARELATLHAKGARFFIDPTGLEASSPVARWLAEHAEVAGRTATGTIWRFL